MDPRRRIVAWTNLTLDGYTSGPDGPAHDTWLYEHVGQAQTAEYFEGIWRGADTIVLGRTNYEGFYSVWPAMTRDERTDPRNRELGRWLDATEKVVVSRTLTEAPWENSRIARDLAAAVKERASTRSASLRSLTAQSGCTSDVRSFTVVKRWCSVAGMVVGRRAAGVQRATWSPFCCAAAATRQCTPSSL